MEETTEQEKELENVPKKKGRLFGDPIVELSFS